MPKGTGIYEDEPREYRKTYTPDSKHRERENALRDDSTAGDSESELGTEPPD